MNKHLRHLYAVLRHKALVLYTGRKMGLPLGRLLRHDLSKFSGAEWSAYAENFYGGWSRENRPKGVERAFMAAWRHHYRENEHHWEYWALTPEERIVFEVPDGLDAAHPMPDEARREMLADWWAFGLGAGEDPPVKDWYEKTRHKRKLHPETRAWVENEIRRRFG